MSKGISVRPASTATRVSIGRIAQISHTCAERTTLAVDVACTAPLWDEESLIFETFFEAPYLPRRRIWYLHSISLSILLKPFFHVLSVLASSR